MFIATPYCSFKCDKESGVRACQNSELALLPTYEMSPHDIIKRYRNNPITQAVVFGGLEPFDSADEVLSFIHTFRVDYGIFDDVVIYTGYTEQECRERGWLDNLVQYKNIVVKFGRYIPNQESHYDPVLGVSLASSNQYAKRIDAKSEQEYRAKQRQLDYCDKHSLPYFVPYSGICPSCGADVYDVLGEEKSGEELITCCPKCHTSFCD